MLNMELYLLILVSLAEGSVVVLGEANVYPKTFAVDETVSISRADTRFAIAPPLE